MMSSQFQEKSSPEVLVREYGGDSYTSHETYDGDVESESVSEAGDIGDRALPISQNTLSQPRGFSSPVSPLPKQLACPISVDAKVQKLEEKTLNNKELPKLLVYGSSLIHLAVFGILGVLTRYLLQKLFGPGVAGVTSNLSILYPDLPSNMVGSFLMGWFGVVFKPSISQASDLLAIGLTTGYLGSLTTFSGWNQNMIELSFEGHWVSSLLGFVIGLFLVAYSIIFGVETAKGFRLLLEKRLITKLPDSNRTWRVDSRERHVTVMALLLLMLCLLWTVSVIYVREEFREENGDAQLWLACIVGPLGVWMRWFLARMNDRGLGKAALLSWVPFGTLVANVCAACLMASLSTVKKAVNTKTFDTITIGIQLGFLGCLSTVSTFIAEFNAMRESMHPWRAYAYAMITICISFALGTLIYSVPVLIK